MSWFVWVLLGLVQGLTEFLPVSSSGHLVLAQRLFGLSVPGVVLEVTVHVATALAVIVLFAREIWAMIAAVSRWFVRNRRGLRGRSRVRDDLAWRALVTNLVLATVVTSLIGFGFQPFFRSAFENPVVAAAMLLVTGVVLYLSDRLRRGRRVLADIGPVDAMWVGVAQGLAILPGLSRSGLTIVGGLARKMTGVAAARFSFLLSLAAITGAALVEAVGSPELGAALAAGLPVQGLVIAFVAAFVSGLGAMVFLTRIIERNGLGKFAWYCWAAGAASLVWLLLVRP